MFTKLRLSIRLKLFFSILFIILISYSTLVYTTVEGVDASLEEKTNKDLGIALKYVQSQYFTRANYVKYSLMQPASAQPLKKHLAAGDDVWLNDALERWHRVLPFVEVMAITDSQKKVIASLGKTAKGTTMELGGTLEKALATREPVISTEIVPHDFVCREAGGEFCATLPKDGEAMMVTIVIPVTGKWGELLGCLVAGDIVNRDPQLPYQVQEILGKGVEVTITQGGMKIASSLEEDFTTLDTIPPEVLSRLQKKEPYRGEARIGPHVYKTLFEPISNLKGEFIGSLSVALSKEDFKKIRMDNLRNILTSAVLGILLSFAIAYVAAHRLTGPLKELAESAGRIEKGELGERVNVRRTDEFGLLASSFNNMASSLAERDRTIKKKTADLEELNRRLQELNGELEKRVAVRTAELQMEKGRLEAILTSMAEGVVVTDGDNRVILFNPAAQKMLELVPFWMLDKPFHEVCESRGFCPLAEEIEKIRNSTDFAAAGEVDINIRGKMLKVSLSPLRDSSDKFAGTVMSIRDVTLDGEMDRMKTEFISTVSHELKTPITSIKGSLQFIMNKGEGLTGTERELIAVSLRNTDRLIRLINDILDISKIESGRMELTLRPHSLHEMIANAVEGIEGFARSNRITVINRVSASLAPVYCDHDRVIQVVTNLLANAVKFSPEGNSVTIDARKDGNFLAVSVEDGGTAIRAADREKLFRKFQKLATPDNRDQGGTGLGLAISKEIVEKHQGKIYYTAGRNGLGNIFTFTLPVLEEHV